MIDVNNLTQDQQIEEIIKCRRDPTYYIENYCKVKNPIQGIIPFKLYEFQRDLILNHLNKNRFNIILKSRQMGISTIHAAYAVWLASFFTAKTVLIIANKGEVATNFINIVKTAIEYVPDFIKPKIRVYNRQSIEFANGSLIKATSTTRDAGKSEAVSLLIFDEAAIIPHAKEVWTAASPTLATGGGAVVLSTPKGVSNWFHEEWSKAVQGLNEFVPITLPWNLHPDRNEQWKEIELRKIGETLFAQEYGCDFLRSGNTVIDQNSLLWYKTEGHIVDPFQKTNFDNNLWIWKYPDYTKHYLISADVARGDGADYSTAQVICIEDMEQVAEYKGKIPTDIFGHLLVELGTKYNTASLIPENNSIGWGTIQKILELNYSNLYWSSKNMILMNPDDWGTPDGNKVPGIFTGTQRKYIFEKLEEAIRNHIITIHSVRLYEELTTFIYKDGKPQAGEGYNDDLVLAMAIGIYARQTSMKLLENRSKAYDNMPVLFDNKRTEFAMAFDRSTKANPFMQGNEDISWIIRG